MRPRPLQRGSRTLTLTHRGGGLVAGQKHCASAQAAASSVRAPAHFSGGPYQSHRAKRLGGKREREREVRPLPQVVATLTARPRLGGEKRRASPLPPLFFSFFFLSWVRTSKTAHRQSSTPMGFGERETEELSPDTAPAGSLGVCPTTLFSRGGGTDRVTRPLSLRASPFAQTTSFLPLPVGTWLRTRERLAFFTQTGAGCSLPIPNPRRP